MTMKEIAIQIESARANSTASLPRSSHSPPLSYNFLAPNLRSEHEMLSVGSISVPARTQAEFPRDVYRRGETAISEDGTIRACYRDIYVSDIVVCAVWGRGASSHRRRPIRALASICCCCGDI